MLSHWTGLKIVPQDLLMIGERIITAKRVMNLRPGATVQDDRLPKHALTDGPVARHVPDLNRQLKEYYALRGWDSNTGYLSLDKLRSLGIESLAAYLPSRK
jgi:aldehyde:ferredoxin oxidoreductase